MGNPNANYYPFNSPSEAIRFRFDEYSSVIENTAKLSDRRQTINDIFVGLNSLFLTALGFLFISLQLTTWWPTAMFGGVAIITTLVNLTWRQLNNRYRQLINVRLAYANALEKQMEDLHVPTLAFDVPDGHQKNTMVSKQIFGVLHLEEARLYFPGSTFGFSIIEGRLIQIFLVSYIALTILIAVLTQLVMMHLLPGLSIKQ